MTWLYVILLFILLYYGSYFVLRGRRPEDPQLIAHRGGSKLAPENTLAAFRNAVRLGAGWLELDLHRTKDGVLVVIHDETVDRTTGGTGRVVDKTLAEVQALDAGEGERVPVFDEVIAFAKEAGVGLLPEVKSTHLYPGIAGEVAAQLAGGGMVGRARVLSFDHEILARLRQIDPALQTIPLFGLWQFNLKGGSVEGVEVLAPMAEMAVLFPWMIRQAHRLGRQIFIWFGAIESPIVMRFLLWCGADGLIVDDPAALARVLGRRS